MCRAILVMMAALSAVPTVAAEAPKPADRTDAEGVPLPPEALARLGSSRFWHAGFIQLLKFSPDGRTLFTGAASRDGLYAWDAATGRLRWRHEFGKPRDNEKHFDRDLSPSDIGFSDATVAIVLPDKQKGECVVRFDRASGREVGRTQLPKDLKLERYRFSPDGSRVAVTAGMDLAVYDAANGRRLFSHRTGSRIPQLDVMDFSPDGGAVAVTLENGAVHLLRADNGRVVWTRPTGAGRFRALRFAPRGDMIILQPDFFPVLLLDAANGKIRHRLEPAGAYHLHGIATMPDGKELLTGGRVFVNGVRQVCIIGWNLVTQKEVRRFDYEGELLMAISPDGRFVALGAGQWVSLYDLRKKEWCRQGSAPTWGYQDFRQRPDGRWMGLGNGVEFFNEDGRFLSSVTPFTGFNKLAAHLSPDGTRLLHYRQRRPNELRGALETWDTVAQKPLAAFGEVVGAGPVASWDKLLNGHLVIGFSADSKLVYTRTEYGKPLQAWDVRSGKGATVPRGLRTTGTPRAHSPDGRWAAVTNHHLQPGGGDVIAEAQVLSLIETSTGKITATFKELNPWTSAVVFSPDGRMLAVAWDHLTDIMNKRPLSSDDLVYVYEVPSGRELGRLRGPDRSVMDIAFAPNGRMIATATVNQTTRLWEVGTWAARHAFPGVPTQLGKAAFSQDSRILAAKGADAPAYLWDVYGARTRTGPKPDAAALDRAWNDLASRDAAIGFRAIRTLITAPDDAVRLLRERLKPESALDATVLRRLLGELESPDFATRERATKEISDAVGNVEPAIRKALTESRSPEARRRLKVVLSHVGKPSPETLRAVRGVEALEVIGSETARALLKELARGPSGQRLTMEAQAAMARAKP